MKKTSISNPKTVNEVIGSFYLKPSVPALFDFSSVKTQCQDIPLPEWPIALWAQLWFLQRLATIRKVLS